MPALPIAAAPGGPGPAGMPPVGAGTAPGQPPFGSSPMTMPVPNAGLKAAALAQLQWAVRIMEKALPMLGIGSDEGKSVMKALTSLSKLVPPGSTSPGVENSALQQMMLQARQEQPMLSMLKGGQAGGAGMPPGAAAGAGAPASPTPPPMAA